VRFMPKKLSKKLPSHCKLRYGGLAHSCVGGV
jgi:hypothetical protein